MYIVIVMEAIQTLRDRRSPTARAGVGQEESAIGQRITFSVLVSCSTNWKGGSLPSCKCTQKYQWQNQSKLRVT